MTSFARNSIPDSVDTVEKLVVWAGAILAEANDGTRLAVNTATLDAVASAGAFTFALQPDAPLRYVITAYVPLDPGYRSGGNVWEQSIQELSQGDIPVSYTN